MNIFKALRDHHDIQRKLILQLTDTSGNTKIREKIFSQLKLELKRHAKSEERFFYAPLLENDLTQKISRYGISEHKELDDCLKKLEKTDMSSSSWLITAKKLEEKLLHHLNEEEHDFFQLAGKVLTEKQKENLAKEYENLMKNSATV